jgi:hypothetical protein
MTGIRSADVVNVWRGTAINAIDERYELPSPHGLRPKRRTSTLAYRGQDQRCASQQNWSGHVA